MTSSRKWKLLLYGGLFLGVAGTAAGLYWRSYLASGALGSPCSSDADCRSAQCLRRERPGTPGGRHAVPLSETEGWVCTDSCQSDGDCSELTRCGEAIRSPGLAPAVVTDRGPRGNSRVCVPR